METVSTKKRFLIISKVLSIFLLLVVVQAQETSLLSEPDSSQDSEDTQLPLETQEFPLNSEETSVSSESEFPQVSENTNEPLETNQFPPETELDSEFHLQYPPSPAPSPSKTPTPPKAPYPPKSPQNTCKTKCATKCLEKKTPFLHNLCNKICRQKCMLVYAQVIYSCTNHCAESMPTNFKSDKKKAAGYVKYCYHKCIKKF